MDHYEAIGLAWNSQEISENIRRFLDSQQPRDDRVHRLQGEAVQARFMLYELGPRFGVATSYLTLGGKGNVVDFDPCLWGSEPREFEIRSVFQSYSGIDADTVACIWVDCPGPEFVVNITNWVEIVGKLRPGNNVKLDIGCICESGKLGMPESKKARGVEVGYMRHFIPRSASGQGSVPRADLHGPVLKHQLVRNQLSGQEVAILAVDPLGWPQSSGTLAVIGAQKELREWQEGTFFTGVVWLQAMARTD